MAVRLKQRHKQDEKSRDKSHSWLTTGLTVGVGLAFGYGIVPAYAGMIFASQVPTIALPIIGSALTEAARIQAMTKAYNIAMTAAPAVSAVSSKILASTVDAVSSYAHSDSASDIAEENLPSIAAAA